MIYIVRLPERNGRIVAIYGRRRCEYQRFNVSVSQKIEYCDGTGYIDIRVETRVSYRRADPGTRGQVDDTVNICRKFRKRLSVTYITLNHNERIAGSRAVQVGLLNTRIVKVVERVKADYALSCGEKVVNDMGTYESGRAGH